MEKLLNQLQIAVNNDLLYQLIVSAIIILLGIIFGKIISLIFKKILKPLTQLTDNEYDDIIVRIIEKGLFKLINIGAIYIALLRIQSELKIISPISGESLADEYPYLNSVLNVLEIALFIYIIFVILKITFNLTSALFDWYASKIHADDNRNLSGSLFPLLKKVTKIVLTAIAVVALLSKFNVNISGLLVSLGVGSLAIALAAQETISNMISGFIIMTDRPFRIGDRIRYGAAGETGDVLEIGIRSTKIRDFDNNIVVIPNNEIVKSRVTNFTYPDTTTRVVIVVGVAYGTEIAKVREILLSLANAHQLKLPERDAEVVILNFGESSVDIRLSLFTDHYSKAWQLTTELREQIYNEFIKAGIEIPFPQRVVTLLKD